MRSDPTTNDHIEELVRLASALLTPQDFAAGLSEAQSSTLLTLHESIATRYGARAASRAVARLGGVGALQQLLKARHTSTLGTRRQARLMAELDEMLRDTEDIDRIREGRPAPPDPPDPT